MLRFDAVHRAVDGLMEGALIGAPWDQPLLDLALAAEAAGATLVRTQLGSRDIVLPTGRSRPRSPNTMPASIRPIPAAGAWS